jgi:hypothetical protein
VREFAEESGIGDCVLEAERLPLWFMVDVPDSANESQLGEHQRSRYYGWWWLVFISRQNTDAATKTAGILPPSKFASLVEDFDAFDRMVSDDGFLGLPVLDEGTQYVVGSMTDPNDSLGPLYFNLLKEIRRARAAFPARFTPQFWIDHGVSPDFIEGASYG